MTKLLKKLWSNEFFQGGVFITTASILGNILNYFFNLLAGRALGPIGYGEITALFSYSTILSVPILVITMVIIQKLGAKGESRLAFAKSLEDWFLARLKKWWPLTFAVLVLTPFLPRITNLSTTAAYAFFPLIILSLISSFYGALVQGLRLFFWVALIGITSAALKLLGALLALIWGGSVTTIIVFLLVSTIFGTFAYHYIITKMIRPASIKTRTVITRRALSLLIDPQFSITFISLLAITVLNNADVIFVKKFFSPIEAGIYSSWSLFAKIVLYAIGPLTSVGYIFFTSRENETFHRKTLLISLTTLFLISIISYLSYTYLSAFIVNLFFGQKFNSVIPYLGYASIFGSLYTGITFVNNYFIAKKEKFALILPIMIPIYILFLFASGKNLLSVMRINIFFSTFVLGLYLIVFASGFFYNRAHGETGN